MSAPPQAAPLEPGAIIAGKYRIDGILGSGGMGVVLAATHLSLAQPVAIKVLARKTMGHEGVVPRFLREARAAARVHDEHVVRVFDVGALADGTPYIVMERLEGQDLEKVLRRRGLLPVQEAVECLLQACEGIAAAHAVGVVHRDVKPGNLFRCEHPGQPPLVKILDFGVSKLLSEPAVPHDPIATGPNVIVGSPLYASPEQISASRSVDARTDIWGLGAIAYEMLAGAPPFVAPTVGELCVRVLRAAASPLHLRRVEVSPALAEVIGRCLEKDPDARFQTVLELAVALGPFAPLRAQRSIERIASHAAASARAGAVNTLRSRRTTGAPGIGRAPRATETTADDAWESAAGSRGVLRWALGAALVGGLISSWVATSRRASPEQGAALVSTAGVTTAAAPVASLASLPEELPAEVAPVSSAPSAAKVPPPVRPEGGPSFLVQSRP